MFSIDIILDNCGFMETWGVLAFVPSVYTLHTRLLVAYPSDLPDAAVAALFAVGLASLALNYLADWQRRAFRDGRLVGAAVRARYLEKTPGGEATARETRLLCSHMWGWCRHPQYMFELGCAYTWGILGCPWRNRGLALLYPATLTVLLVHRCLRDEAKCAAKYGKAYTAYCELVPWRMVPRVW